MGAQQQQAPPPPIQIEVAPPPPQPPPPPPSSSSAEGTGGVNNGGRRDMKHDLSPEIASKSLSALKDRKEEILSELGNIVGTSNAQAIGDLASEQAASNGRFGFDLETP